MKSYTNLIEVTNVLIGEDGTKSTKASNKRRRGLINQIQKLAVEAKRDLIAQDGEK